MVDLTSGSTVPRSQGIRERHREQTEAAILKMARTQLADVGAAALSLRSVARELGMVSSAVYRYVATRDELLTRLIVQAYDELGDAVDESLHDVPADELDRRFATISRTLRRWALAHPHDFALLYGSPVPHYDAPADRTNVAGTRVQTHLVQILAVATARRAASPSQGGPAEPEGAASSGGEALRAGAASLSTLLADPLFAATPVAPDLLLRGLAAWAMVMGSLTAELFEQNGPDLSTDPEAHFEAVIVLALRVVGLSS